MKLYNLELGGLCHMDFSEPYIEYAEHEDGTPLTIQEIDLIPQEWINEQAKDFLY